MEASINMEFFSLSESYFGGVLFDWNWHKMQLMQGKPDGVDILGAYII